MKKMYRVFVSSTYEDLKEERKIVMDALIQMDCLPVGMELFPASNDKQMTLIKKAIDSCDLYILLIAGRYGTIAPDEGISYTEKEGTFTNTERRVQRIRKAVTKAKIYISPYQRIIPKTGTPGKISG